MLKIRYIFRVQGMLRVQSSVDLQTSPVSSQSRSFKKIPPQQPCVLTPLTSPVSSQHGSSQKVIPQTTESAPLTSPVSSQPRSSQAKISAAILKLQLQTSPVSSQPRSSQIVFSAATQIRTSHLP